MSLLSGIVTLPWFRAIQTYQQAFYQYPLMEENKEIPKNDPRYQEILSRLPGQQIKAEMQELLDRFGIRKDVIFVENDQLKGVVSCGTNFSPKGDAAVFINPKFKEIDKDAFNWAIKYTISHLKNNDTFTLPLVPGICRLAAAIFGMCFLSFIPAVALALTVDSAVIVLFSRWRAAKTDDFAIKNSSDEELKGARRFLIAQKQRNIALRILDDASRILISESGNEKFAFSKPSLTSRIEKIEKALRARSVDWNDEQEQVTINQLKEWIHA